MSLFASSLFAGGSGGSGGISTFPVVIETNSILNLVVDDNLKFFVMNSPAPQIIIIPENTVETFPVGAEIEFIREGQGTVTFTVFGAAVLQSRDSLLSINARYSAATLKKIDTDEWRLIGDLI